MKKKLNILRRPRIAGNKLWGANLDQPLPIKMTEKGFIAVIDYRRSEGRQ